VNAKPNTLFWINSGALVTVDGVSLFTVNDGVDTRELIFVAHTESHGLFNDPTDEVGHSEGEDQDDNRGEGLLTQLLK